MRASARYFEFELVELVPKYNIFKLTEVFSLILDRIDSEYRSNSFMTY